MKAISTVHDIFQAALEPYMPMAVIERTEEPHHSVTYTITGWRWAVDQACKRIFDKYHPAGYGTYLVSLNVQGDGQTVAVVKRSASCE